MTNRHLMIVRLLHGANPTKAARKCTRNNNDPSSALWNTCGTSRWHSTLLLLKDRRWKKTPSQNIHLIKLPFKFIFSLYHPHRVSGFFLAPCSTSKRFLELYLASNPPRHYSYWPHLFYQRVVFLVSLPWVVYEMRLFPIFFLCFSKGRQFNRSEFGS